MIDDKPQISAKGDEEPHDQSAGGDFSAQLGATTCGRLVFASGAADVQLEANQNPTLLYNAYFEEHLPSVRVRDSVVTIQYRRHLLFDGLGYLHQPLARVALNRTIPWEIEFRDGVSRLTADLHHLQVRALDMGSVSTALLTLPIPTGLANIYLSGSASDLTLHRPTGAALCLHIAGAASHLLLDDQRFGATHGGVHWQSRDYHDNANRYDLEIAGSVSNLMIDTF